MLLLYFIYLYLFIYIKFKLNYIKIHNIFDNVGIFGK